MTHKAITLIVVVLVLAIALGIMVSNGVVHSPGKYPVPIDQAEAVTPLSAPMENPDGRLSRVRLVLSR